MTKKPFYLFIVVAAFFIGMIVGPMRIGAATPGILSYQGRVLVSSVPFTGTGQFKFALVNSAGTTTFWSNDGTSTSGSEPTAAVSLAVTNGLYSVLLGDTTISGMTQAIPATAFDNADVRLRIWFNDGTNGSKLLSPDQRIAPVGYAQVAKGVDDGSITTAKISNLPKIRVFNTQQQSINDQTSTVVGFNTVQYSQDIALENGTKLRVSKAGYYRIYATLFWTNDSTSGSRGMGFRINGAGGTDIAVSNIPGQALGAGDTISTDYFLNANDFVEITVFQTSGSTRTIDASSGTARNRCEFGMSYVP